MEKWRLSKVQCLAWDWSFWVADQFMTLVYYYFKVLASHHDAFCTLARPVFSGSPWIPCRSTPSWATPALPGETCFEIFFLNFVNCFHYISVVYLAFRKVRYSILPITRCLFDSFLATHAFDSFLNLWKQTLEIQTARLTLWLLLYTELSSNIG